MNESLEEISTKLDAVMCNQAMILATLSTLVGEPLTSELLSHASTIRDAVQSGFSTEEKE